MNGRVYDPTLGRFISADPTVQAPFMSQSLNRYSYVLNSPLSMIDPSGFNFLSSAWRSIKHFVHKWGRMIAAVAVAVVSFGYLAPVASGWLASAYVCTAITTGGAAIAGAISGALAGAIMGGWKGALVGAVSGALFGASNVAWGQVGNAFGRGVGEAVTSGTIGGVSSEALGGSFRVGFWTGFAASAAYNIYKAVADNYDPTWKPGDKVVEKNPGDPAATPDSINPGLARTVDMGPVQGWWKWVPWYEGNYWFRALNYIPGFNSFATFHDWLSTYIKPTWLFVVADVPSMAPALAINYASLMNGPQLIPVMQRESDH
jgi:hypothetical protein